MPFSKTTYFFPDLYFSPKIKKDVISRMISKSKKVIISLLVLTAIYFNLFTAYTDYAKYEIPVLLYHNIVTDDNYHMQGLMHITQSNFKDHMLKIKEAGYNPILFEDLINAADGKFQLPQKPILITFDDGYYSNYEYAYPILRDFGFKATIFVVTSSVGLSGDGVVYPHFTWEQAAQMQQSGVISIQSHSNTHRDFSLLSDDEAFEDMLVSKRLIESSLGTGCVVFSYPYGKFTTASRSFSELSGFAMEAFVADSSANTVDADTCEFYRLTVDGVISGDDLVRKIISDN